MEILTLTHLTLERLKNAEHVQYHTNVRNLIEEADTEKIGLSDLVFNTYTQAISTEQDIVNRAQGSAYTLEMQEADQKRDLIFKRIRRKLELCELEDPESEAYKASPVVRKHFLDKYGMNVVNLPQQEQTATITGFIMDARSILDPEAIEAIGIDADLDDLQAANRQFNKLYQARVAEKAAGDTQLSLKLRAATDQAYRLLEVSLNSLANDPNPANKAKAEACHTLMGKVNVVIKEAKDRLNQRLSGTGEGDGDGNSGSSEGTGDTANSGNSGGTTNSGTGTTGSGSGSGSTQKPPVTPPATGTGDDDVME